QTLNRFVGGRQEVGHIDLLDTISYFEVPEKDAKKVMIQLTGIRYKGRTVRCNDADEGGISSKNSSVKPQRETRSRRDVEPKREKKRSSKKEDWRSLMNKVPRDLRGEEPDFSEEGWAMRKPRKKKK
ncbi:MAG: DbpA RNA binding domain-containing protein, partial [Prevotella sp.]|nr:DbpA RNA binding domain-containing protein [Prevotella sp.]